MRSSIARALVTRTAPVVVGSVLLHVGVAMALVASAGGHARAGVSLPVASLDVDVVEVASPTLEPTEVPPPEPEVAKGHEEAAPTHTHPYPVAPSHDARPHDPSMRHDDATHEAHEAQHDHEASEPAQAAPVAVAADVGALPRFTIASGVGVATGGPVSANGGASANTGGVGTGASAGGDDVVVAASSVQVAARLVQSVAAAYPAGARSDDIEGEVGVEIVLDREGRVIEARVVRPAGHGFDEAALKAVRAYRFSPAQREGHTVRVRMPWTVQFRLR